MAKATTQGGREVVRLTLPVGDIPAEETYCARHLEVNCLSSEQALAMRRLFDGLQASVGRLRSGRVIATPADAIRWMLEQLAEQLNGNGAAAPPA